MGVRLLFRFILIQKQNCTKGKFITSPQPKQREQEATAHQPSRCFRVSVVVPGRRGPTGVSTSGRLNVNTQVHKECQTGLTVLAKGQRRTFVCSASIIRGKRCHHPNQQPPGNTRAYTTTRTVARAALWMARKRGSECRQELPKNSEREVRARSCSVALVITPHAQRTETNGDATRPWRDKQEQNSPILERTAPRGS